MNGVPLLSLHQHECNPVVQSKSKKQVSRIHMMFGWLTRAESLNRCSKMWFGSYVVDVTPSQSHCDCVFIVKSRNNVRCNGRCHSHCLWHAHTDWSTVRDNDNIAPSTSLYSVQHPCRFKKKQQQLYTSLQPVNRFALHILTPEGQTKQQSVFPVNVTLQISA